MSFGIKYKTMLCLGYTLNLEKCDWLIEYVNKYMHDFYSSCKLWMNIEIMVGIVNRSGYDSCNHVKEIILLISQMYKKGG